MEESNELIGELLGKLIELNGKVDEFRQNILSEFNNYTEHLLKDVSPDVSIKVGRAIAESMAQFPLLSPSITSGGHEQESQLDSPGSATRTTPEAQRAPREGRKSPPPVLHHTSGVPKTSRQGDSRQRSRSAHARELEFQGVFTPSYLPLLDGTDPLPPRKQRADYTYYFRRDTRGEERLGIDGQNPGGEPPYYTSLEEEWTETTTTDNDDDETPVVEMIEEVEPASTDKGKGKEVIRPSDNQGASPSSSQAFSPSSARAATDFHTPSSVGSSSSEHKIRRSALRRSSSSTKGSPRRVRFDVEGAEVLPTSSPQQSESVLEAMAGGEGSSAIDDSEEYSGPSLLDVEGEEDDGPRPPRISSTEALRRLSRTPSDDGTVWIASNEAGQSGTASAAGTTSTTTSGQMAWSSGAQGTPQHAASSAGTRAAQATARVQAQQEEDDDDSEEEFLAIRKSGKKAASPTVPSPSAASPSSAIIAAQVSYEHDGSSGLKEELAAPSAAKDKGKGKETVQPKQAEEEGLFDFDDPATGSAKTEKYLPDDDDHLPEDDDDDEAVPKKGPVVQDDAAPTNAVHLSRYSSSPAVPVPKRETSSPPMTVIAMKESIGSYKGQPLRMTVVTNPEVMKQAAKMGDIKTYVGSVHGRTGVDPADESSYRASFSNAKVYSGTPRSFSERMMMEKALGTGDEGDLD